MGKKLLIFAGVTTLLQAVTQVVLSGLSIAQYLGLIDFLRDLPHLIFIKILYYHNPARHSNVITIGHAIEGIANQAFVLISREPFTATRTFIINCTYLSLGFLWAISSSILLAGGALNEYSRPIRWPWIAVSVAVCAVDLVATVIFANDSFHTKTLNNIMNYIGGTANGVGGISIDTSATAWIMVIIYSRFVIIFIVNVVVIILVALNKNKSKKDGLNLVESPVPIIPPTQHSTPSDQRITSTLENENNNINTVEVTEQSISPILKAKLENGNKTGLIDLSDIIEEINNNSSFDSSTENINKTYNITYGFNMPRASFSRTFWNTKKKIFKKDTSVQSKDDLIDRHEIIEHSPERSPQLQLSNRRAVNFPENLLSLPQRMESMIAAEQLRLDRSVKDPSGPMSGPHSLPAKAQTSDAELKFNKGRRDTAPELNGQFPWTYIPETPYRLYWDLPSDDEPPPIPLADYTAIGVASGRKTSVHRSPPMPKLTMKSLKKHQKTRLPQNSKMTLKEVDVLF